MTRRNFIIEEISDLDAAWPELEALLKGLIDYHRPWDDRTLSPGWSAWLRDYMRNETTLVARDDGGAAVAFLSGGVTREENVFVEVYGHVDNVFVLEEFRQSGVGSELLSRFEMWCQTEGAAEVRLDVAAGNGLGRSFWAHKGFVPMHAVLKKPIGVAP